MTGTPRRWGVAGLGRAFTLMLPTFVADPRVRLCAAADPRAEARARFTADFDAPAYATVDELCADPAVDVVYVASPHQMHASHAIAAARHGKHVLVEKPFTLTAAEAAAVRDVAARSGLLAMEAMWTRYLPHMIRVRELVAAGALGDIRAVLADHTQKISTDPAHRLNNLDLGGGALLDLGIYPISFAWDILGAPNTVTATATIGPTGVDDEVATIFTHASGALSTSLSASHAAGPNTAHIIGTDARIDIDQVWYSPTTFRLVSPDGAVLESYESHIDGRGMQFQALAAERYVASGANDSEIQPIDETVAIMGTLDEVRRQIGLRYPSED